MSMRRFGFWFLAVWLAMTMALQVFSRWTVHPLSGGETAWVGMMLFVLGSGAVVLHRLLPKEHAVFWEYLRIGVLLWVVCWLFEPFFTSRLIGGADARWYGYVMADALEQARAGVWPVFVGQGEFMFNGAIHPFRTAPYYTNAGILLDLATFRVLSPLAVQHLLVLATATVAALVSYGCLVALLPHRRWLACGLALLYVSTPATLAYIYIFEMYMTFTTLAWMPLIIYGNIRLFQKNDAIGWIAVVAGLALVWYGHAPVGSWATMFTVGVQGLRLLARDRDLSSVRGGGWRRRVLRA